MEIQELIELKDKLAAISPEALTALEPYLPARVELKYELVRDYDMTPREDYECRRLRHGNTGNSMEVDFPATIHVLVQVAGAPTEGEHSAYKQAAIMAARYRAWKHDALYYFGIVMSAYYSTNKRPNRLIPAGDTSIYGIASDCGQAYLQARLEELKGELLVGYKTLNLADPEMEDISRQYLEITNPDYSHLLPVPQGNAHFDWDAEDSGEGETYWICRVCGIQNPELTPEEFERGECQNTNCGRYHYAYIQLGDGAVRHLPERMTYAQITATPREEIETFPCIRSIDFNYGENIIYKRDCWTAMIDVRYYLVRDRICVLD